jgi:hypothetical protein
MNRYTSTQRSSTATKGREFVLVRELEWPGFEDDDEDDDEDKKS